MTSTRIAPDNATRTRPNMPNYGIPTEENDAMLTWDWVSEQMLKSRNYWIATSGQHGKPHASPVWGVWMDEALYFGCSPKSVKARNFAHKPFVSVNLESGDDAVIIEGIVARVTDKAILNRLSDVYFKKYPPFKPDMDGSDDSLYFVVKPKTVFAWLEKDFVNTATRWLFKV